MHFVYLASRYTDEDPNVMAARYHDACRATAWLAASNVTVYSPIVHWHEVARTYKLPTDAKYWEQHNFCMLYWASKLIVLATEGWRDSVGISDELRQAERLGTSIWLMKPIAHREYILDEYAQIPQLVTRI